MGPTVLTLPYRDAPLTARVTVDPHHHSAGRLVLGPPIRIGGDSPAAIRRTVRHGDAWHPVGVTTRWLEEHGLPALRVAAEQATRPQPPTRDRVPR